MNSIVKVPIQDPTDNSTTFGQPFSQSITISNSKFYRFSNCGSIVSNQFGYLPDLTLSSMQQSSFSDSVYP